MLNRSRLLGLLLAVVTASLLLLAGVALAALPPGGTFTDDNGNIHEPNIEAIAAEGITKGCNPPSNTRYCPSDAVTRGQIAVFLDRALDWPSTTRDFFSDDDGSVYEESINRMAAVGVTTGCSTDQSSATFCPDERATREQMAAFLVRAFGYTESTVGDRFTDDNTSVFETDINRLATAGVTTGCNPPANTKFCPTSPVRRDQMASFLARALELDPIPPASSVPPPSDGWVPAPGVTWQWQLTGTIDTSVDADMFDVDLFDTPMSVVSTLHSQGRAVVCYLSAGSWEDWRPDADDFPSTVLGESNGWAGERWLDIRRLDILGPIMEARLDLCQTNGYDGVEVDNIDGYTNSTGFPLTGNDQLTYNRFLANAAHDRGLSIGLKNNLDQIDQLVDVYDFAINEQCAQYNECDTLTPFINADKAVFHVEYSLTTSQFCPTTTDLGFSSMRKHLDLDAWKEDCP